jgi:hypothetical protein
MPVQVVESLERDIEMAAGDLRKVDEADAFPWFGL